jgi:hypothetical protein
MTRPDPRTFGRATPYIAPAVRRRKAANRIAAVYLGSIGMVALFVAYVIMGTASRTPGPNTAAFIALMLGLSGFGLLALGIIAATEA